MFNVFQHCRWLRVFGSVMVVVVVSIVGLTAYSVVMVCWAREVRARRGPSSILWVQRARVYYGSTVSTMLMFC